MKKTAKSLIFTLILLASAVPAFSWGQKGHDIVAAIAEANLTPEAKAAVKEILHGHSIVYYSSWMDNMQNLPEWKSEYQRTKTWHYGNVDEGLTYDLMPKCETGDVLTATNEVIKSLKEGRLSAKDKEYYLKMLIHLIGDMHCPMHAGRLSDKGGNFFDVYWFKQPTNLHSVWDSKIVESARKWSYSEWRDNLNILNDKQIDSITAGTPYDWFVGTTVLARNLYSEIRQKANLSYDYVATHSQMLEQQLTNAGYRLAKVLNEIFK